MEDGDVFDFRGMRLDWFRLQVRRHQENETSFVAVRQTWVQRVFRILSQCWTGFDTFETILLVQLHQASSMEPKE